MLGAERILRALQEHDVDYGGYADLARGAVEMQIEDVHVRVASLEDVIRSKEAADRPRDREQLPTLRRLLDDAAGE